MDRINGSNVAPDLFGAGKNGFRNGNKALGIAATDFNAEWCNSMQEEIAQVIENAGITLNGADSTQLYQAINNLIKGGDYKASVRVATTAAINLAAPGANIDGVAMVVGDSFLDKDNATPALRGPYIWNGAAVPATRRSDADTGAELNGGAIIPVEEGTTNADTNWQVTNNGTVTIGATGLTFQKVGSAVDATETANGIAEIATQAEVDAGTDDLRFVTPMKLKAATSRGIGYGQSWQNLTASRALNTTYTNSTGKPIEVQVSIGNSTASPNTANLLIDGSITISGSSFNSSGSITTYVSATIPNGSTYRASGTVGTPTLFHWAELR